MPFWRRERSQSKDKSSSPFRRFLGSRDQAINRTSSLVQTRSNPSLHNAPSPLLTSSSPALRPDINHATSAPATGSAANSHDPEHVATTLEQSRSIQSAAAETTIANTQTILSIRPAAVDERFLQENVSLWDLAYDGLKANDEIKVRKLIDEYEMLLQRDLLSGKTRILRLHSININSVRPSRCV